VLNQFFVRYLHDSRLQSSFILKHLSFSTIENIYNFSLCNSIKSSASSISKKYLVFRIIWHLVQLMAVTTQTVGLVEVTGILVAEINDKYPIGIDLCCGKILYSYYNQYKILEQNVFPCLNSTHHSWITCL
jgi:hypothetical protein